MALAKQPYALPSPESYLVDKACSGKSTSVVLDEGWLFGSADEHDVYQGQSVDSIQSLIGFASDYDHALVESCGSFLCFQQNDHHSTWEGDLGYWNQLQRLKDISCEEIAASSSSNGRDRALKGDKGGSDLPFLEKTTSTLQESASPEAAIGVKRSLAGKRMPAPKKQSGRINLSTTNDINKTKPKTTCSKDTQSMAAKNRRERISERLKTLQELVPNGSKVDLVTMLEKAISYVKFLQLQVKVLATDEFWPSPGGKAPDITQVKEAIDSILSSQKDMSPTSN